MTANYDRSATCDVDIAFVLRYPNIKGGCKLCGAVAIHLLNIPSPLFMFILGRRFIINAEERKSERPSCLKWAKGV